MSDGCEFFMLYEDVYKKKLKNIFGDKVSIFQLKTIQNFDFYNVLRYTFDNILLPPLYNVPTKECFFLIFKNFTKTYFRYDKQIALVEEKQ